MDDEREGKARGPHRGDRHGGEELSLRDALAQNNKKCSADPRSSSHVCELNGAEGASVPRLVTDDMALSCFRRQTQELVS